MDEREILTRFKAGTLDRDSAARLLSARLIPRPAPPAPATPAVPAPDDVRPGAGSAPPDEQAQQRQGDRHGVRRDGPPDGSADGSADGGHSPAPAAAAPPTAHPTSRPGPPPYPPRPHAPDDRIAVVGIAGRYPDAPGVTAFWRNLRDGRDTSCAAPPGPRPGAFPLPAGGRGHFLAGTADFDPEFFGLTDDEGRLLDPQARLLLETAWAALEDAACTGVRLDALTGPDRRPRAVGLYLGVSTADYALLTAEHRARGGRQTPAGGGHGGLAARIAAALGLHGPGRAVDAADASALAAVQLAAEALLRGECAAAVAGGVELLLHPARAREAAGEGVGAVVLKPLHRALADADRVYAVLRTAPAPTAPPGAEVLRETRPTARRRIGDAGAATGIAAFTAAVLQLAHATLAPAADGEQARPWPAPSGPQGAPLPRRAEVSVPDACGHDTRLVLEEFTPPPAPGGARPAGGEPVLLSAPTPEHLTATAARLADWLRDQPDAEAAPEPAAIARVLRSGRAGHPCRLALHATDTARLSDALADFATADTLPDVPGPVPGIPGVRYADLRAQPSDPLRLGGLPETQRFAAALWQAGRTEQLTLLWLSGVDFDWAALDPAPAARATLPLPPTAQLRRTLWLTGPEGDADAESRT
ncbi:polyketide synthase [Streptomyces sp. ODS05-4]|uniref:beta-ketoacyl [acyl carrier protein] synthase domain-containing protein n=1 Tax=Streptomyces sp. ODS05-4 TaxID=2944939 RepID=UPI00210D9903|nr:beta-ketoacyl synthase N-terminal-like domain-containing protein [Streptomyces sp. ODS05-4]